MTPLSLSLSSTQGVGTELIRKSHLCYSSSSGLHPFVLSSIARFLLSGHCMLLYCLFFFLILLLEHIKAVMYQPHAFCLQRLVVKPDQLIKRRGKLGLVGVNLDLQGVKEWLKPRLMKEAMVRSYAGTEC